MGLARSEVPWLTRHVCPTQMLSRRDVAGPRGPNDPSAWGLRFWDDRPPGRESVAIPRDERRQFWAVPLNNVLHSAVCDPVHAKWRIDLRPEVHRQEPIALEPARRHHDEDPKGRIAEAESCWRCFSKESDHAVDSVDCAIDLL